MRKINYRILPLAVIFTLSLHVTAQKFNSPRIRAIIDIGGINPTGLSNNIENSSSIATAISIEKPFFLKDWLYITSGLGIYTQKYFIDAYFVNTGSGIEFKPVKNGVINNKIAITGIKIPILLSFPIFSKKTRQSPFPQVLILIFF